MSKNFTISVTLLEHVNTVKVQATCENVDPTDISYLLGVISNEVKNGNALKGLSREHSGYVEDYIELN